MMNFLRDRHTSIQLFTDQCKLFPFQMLLDPPECEGVTSSPQFHTFQ